jgi:hypothetical protein
MTALKNVAFGVNQHDVIGADFAPVQTARVNQIALRSIGQCHAEMVADAFGQP